MGGNPNAVKGGTGKAEAAKLQDAGISPKQWPKKMSGRKRHFPELGENRNEEQIWAKEQRELLVTQSDHRIDTHRSPCGEPASDKCNSELSRHDGYQSDNVCRRYSVELACNENANTEAE
jgi:hypothetical protein